MKKERPIRTRRLVISPMSTEETAALIAGETDGRIKRALFGTASAGPEISEADEWRVCRRIALRGGADIGALCFNGPPEDGRVELALSIDRSYRGRGFAGEAAAAMLDWAFGHEDVKFVLAVADPDDTAALALLKRLEFVPCGEESDGARYKKAKPYVSWVPIGMCLGVAIGISLGSLLDNVGSWLSLGICFGMLFGLMKDGACRKKYEESMSMEDADQI